VRYEHEWQPGDVVIADNLALLHGRRAFDDAPPLQDVARGVVDRSERRVWRVNVERKKPRTLIDALRDSIRIRRPEFLVAEIPIFLIPFVLVDGASASPYLVWPLVAVFALMFHFGDMVNCYADRDLDAVFKTHQSNAIYGLGLVNVRWQMLVTVALALLLAAQLTLSVGSVVPLALVAGGLVWGAQYSLRPLWLKSRGILATITLCAIIFVGPMVLVVDTLGVLTLPLTALFCAYAVMQMGIILVNTAEDIPEDTDAGIRTAAVALGLTPTLRLATAMTMLGGAGVIALLGFDWTTLPLVAALAYAALGVAGTLRDTRITELRKRSRWMPAWIAATAWATLIATLSM
jgi:4-hydroxybenzoate polyprenyltransferase